MRWPLLLVSLLLPLPALAAPLGVTVAGLEGGAVQADVSVDYGHRQFGVTTDESTTDDEGLPDQTAINTASLGLAVTLQPIRFASLEARARIHKPVVVQADYKAPWGWGVGATLRITPVHAAHDLVHVGAYGAFDGQLIRYPSSPNGPLRIWSLRAGLGLALGGEERGYYADLGVHYSRAWGMVKPADASPVYSLTSTLPIGVQLGAGLISGPVAPASNTRSRVTAGIAVRLIDEWALTIRLGAVF